MVGKTYTSSWTIIGIYVYYIISYSLMLSLASNNLLRQFFITNHVNRAYGFIYIEILIKILY